MRSRASLVFILAIATLVMITAAQVQGARTVTVPKYTVIPVVLDNTVSSATNKVGDRFEGHCYGTNCGGFPANTTFVGKLTVVQPKQPKAPGKLKAEITSAILPDGTQIAVSALPSNEQGIAKEGTTGKSAKPQNRRTGTVAGGAIGAIAGGWAGAAIGTGAGYLVGKAVEGEYTDVTIPAGTKGYITLTAPAKYQVK
ncbi:MAG: hypothetical protein ABFD54_13210 [Armatimonadota bacterium]|nr:hypothetical protein [bacterium]